MNKDDEKLICLKRPKISKELEGFTNQVHWLYKRNAAVDKLYSWLGLHLTLKDHSGIEVVRRGDAEFNEDYIQLVAATVIICDDAMVLLKCKKGDMAGKLTLVQGHCEYDENFDRLPLKYIIESEAKRELNEEIAFKDNNPDNLNYYYNGITALSFNFKPSNEISHYHLGIIQTAFLPSNYQSYLYNPDFISSGEKDKNDIHIIKFDDDISEYDPDSWLKEIFDHFKSTYLPI